PRPLDLDIARVHLGLGDVDETFRWLEIAVTRRNIHLLTLATDRRYDRLRRDPRFRDILRRMNLEPGPGCRPIPGRGGLAPEADTRRARGSRRFPPLRRSSPPCSLFSRPHRTGRTTISSRTPAGGWCVCSPSRTAFRLRS